VSVEAGCLRTAHTRQMDGRRGRLMLRVLVARAPQGLVGEAGGGGCEDQPL
jgi:hypothetical protein